MYDYRRMTERQREQIVENRRAHGYPLHKPPHHQLGEGWYFISAACFEHKHHFSSAAELTALTNRLLEALVRASLLLAGWVVMPNHYHLLVKVLKLCELGNALGKVHGRSAHYVNQRDETPGQQVWYKYSDRKIRSERHWYTCLPTSR